MKNFVLYLVGILILFLLFSWMAGCFDPEESEPAMLPIAEADTSGVDFSTLTER